MLICKLICLFVFIWYASVTLYRAVLKTDTPWCNFVLIAASAVGFLYLHRWLE
jgi:hypothetical protein